MNNIGKCTMIGIMAVMMGIAVMTGNAWVAIIGTVISGIFIVSMVVDEFSEARRAREFAYRAQNRTSVRMQVIADNDAFRRQLRSEELHRHWADL